MLTLLLSLVAPSAFAIDADTFEPAGSGLDEQGGLQLVAPSVGDAGDAYGGLMLVYAHNPVVQVFDDGTRTALVGSQFGAHLMGGYTFGQVLRLDVDVPVYPYVGGQDLSGGAMGDVRVAGVVQLVDIESDGIGLAIVPQLALPTGTPARYTGAGSVSGGLAISAGVKPIEFLLLDANLGVTGARASELGGLDFGSGLSGGVGGQVLLTQTVGVGLEFDGLIGLSGGVGPYNKNPVEAHLYGRYGTGSGLTGTFGLGTGLVAGLGAPDIRVIAGVAYHKPGTPPVHDADADGIPDESDACVDVAEDKDGFEDTDGCPDLDNDKDGVADASDACPADPEDKDLFEDEDGCPDPDNDKDGVSDASDDCPVVAGTPATHGCPDRDGDTLVDSVDQCPDVGGPAATSGCPDRDNDLVPDGRDQCPDVPRDPREDPARSDGCPKKVIITQSGITILDKVYFDANKTTIKKESYALLDMVAQTINANPDITRIEVAGHTDSDGNDAVNLKLSQGRAEAVAKYLVTTGKVDAARLTAKGYGETKPIDTNATAEGKGNNRRVEFTILSTISHP